MSLVQTSYQADLLQAHNPYDYVMSDVQPAPTFADLIISSRKRRNWKQEDLAAASGVSISSISRWERGLSDRPDAAAVRAVCRALGVDPRLAAISLGFLTVEEVQGSPRGQLDPEVEQVLAILEDPHLDRTARQEWINYLKYLHDRQNKQAG